MSDATTSRNTASLPLFLQLGIAAFIVFSLYATVLTAKAVHLASPGERAIAADLAESTALTQSQIDCAAPKIAQAVLGASRVQPGPPINLVKVRVSAEVAAISACS